MNKMFSLPRSIAVVLVTTCLTASNLFAAIITLSPSSSDISIGKTFTLDLTVSELGSDKVGGFELALDYDSDVLEFVQFTPGTQLGTGSDAFLDNVVTPDAVDIAMTSMLFDLSSQPESFSLGVATFRGIGSGISQIALSTTVLSNSDGSAFIPSTSGPAASASVPEPSILPMLAAGMFGIAFWRRRQTR